MRTLSQEFKHGLNAEARVTQYFKSAGYEVLRSSKRDNIEFDIDLIITREGTQQTVSVKSQDDGLRFGHLYVELREGIVDGTYQEWDKDDSYAKRLTYADGRWILVHVRPSWLDNGRADLYAFVQGDELILISKTKVTELVQQELDSGKARVLELSQAKRDRAVRSGHPAIWNQCLYMDRVMVKGYADVVTLRGVEYALQINRRKAS